MELTQEKLKELLTYEPETGLFRWNVNRGGAKKTVVYVCTDEDVNGKPVLNKWQIKKHYIYPQMS